MTGKAQPGAVGDHEIVAASNGAAKVVSVEEGRITELVYTVQTALSHGLPAASLEIKARARADIAGHRLRGEVTIGALSQSDTERALSRVGMALVAVAVAEALISVNTTGRTRCCNTCPENNPSRCT